MAADICCVIGASLAFETTVAFGRALCVTGREGRIDILAPSVVLCN